MGTITNALNLLDHFNVSRPEIGLSEFRRLSGQDKATVHRHLSELLSIGYLEQDAISRRYRIGPAFLRLSGLREQTFPFRRAIAPTMDELADRLGELVLIFLVQGTNMSPAYHKDAQVHGTRVVFDSSETRPMHTTASGIVVLAFGTEEFLNSYLSKPLGAVNSKTKTDPKAIRKWVEETRLQGYAHSDLSCEDEVNSFAMPIYDRDGKANATISVAVPANRATPEKQREILAALREASQSLTQRIGGSRPEKMRHAG